MSDSAPAPAGETMGATDQGTGTATLHPIDAEPPGGETAAEAAEPPEQRTSLWRRLRRSRWGVAALLPALLLAAAFVGSPFSGTTTHPVDRPGAGPTVSAATGSGSGR
jgi:hypothetical protein